MEQPPNNIFRTANTALAAYLISKGLDSPAIDDSNHPMVFFLFNKDNTKIEEYITDFDTARAEGNIVLFFNAYQSLLRRIHEKQ